MSETLFKEVSYNLNKLVGEIDSGEIGLPDIQRPFVWGNAKVRDLFDSMYRGFPVGYLLFWANGLPGPQKQIGGERKQAAARLLIVDGQQRLTSLYAVLKGIPVLREDFKRERIGLAFRPRDETFEVADAAIRKDPEYIPDISARVHRQAAGGAEPRRPRGHGRRQAPHPRGHRPPLRPAEVPVHGARARLVRERGAGRRRLRAHQQQGDAAQPGRLHPDADVGLLGRRPARAGGLLPRGAPALGRRTLALQPLPHARSRSPAARERGARLQARASPARLLAAARQGPRDREVLRRAPRRPVRVAEGLPEPDPEPPEPARLHEGAARGRLPQRRDAQLAHGAPLRLRPLPDRPSRPRRRAPPAALAHGALALLHPAHRPLHELARVDHGAGPGSSRRRVGRRGLRGAPPGHHRPDAQRGLLEHRAAQRARHLRGQEPRALAYWAALNLLGARALFSRLKVADLLDPATKAPRSAVERHHLFPKAHLKATGITKRRELNQIANYAHVEWADNSGISKTPPSEYWPRYAARHDTAELQQMMRWHALPDNWWEMDYPRFLAERRRLMAGVTRDGFARLGGA